MRRPHAARGSRRVMRSVGRVVAALARLFGEARAARADVPAALRGQQIHTVELRGRDARTLQILMDHERALRLTEERDAILASGCDAFLTKPIVRPLLIETVAGWTTRTRSNAA